MTDWQPIDTAPQDGTRLLGYTPGLLVGVYVFWMDEHNGEVYPCVLGIGKLWGNMYKTMWPTHWMPLPSPPQSNREDSQ